MDSRQIITYWILCFVSFFAVINPFRATTWTAMATEGWSEEQRKRAVHRALLVASAVLFCAAWIGNHVIIRSNIHLGGFRVASGILLLTTVIRRMVLNRPFDLQQVKGISEDRALELGFAPLAFPLLSGIAAIATVILYTGEPTELWRRGTTLVALGLTLVLAWGMMRAAPRIHAFWGEQGSRIITHGLDLTIAAWAVDFTAVGVRDLLPLILGTPPAGG